MKTARLLYLIMLVISAFFITAPVKVWALEKGDLYKFGTMNGDEYYRWEDIEWYVLDVEEDCALLLCKKALTVDDLNYWSRAIALEQNVPWEGNYNRLALNDSFYTYSFSEAEKACIIETSSKTDIRDPFAETEADSEENDRLFLLSKAEYEKYCSSLDLPLCENTEHITCSWWLRPSEAADGDTVFWAASADGKGISAQTNFYQNYINEIGIRPAVWIRLPISNLVPVNPGAADLEEAYGLNQAIRADYAEILEAEETREIYGEDLGRRFGLIALPGADYPVIYIEEEFRYELGENETRDQVLHYMYGFNGAETTGLFTFNSKKGSNDILISAKGEVLNVLYGYNGSSFYFTYEAQGLEFVLTQEKKQLTYPYSYEDPEYSSVNAEELPDLEELPETAEIVFYDINEKEIAKLVDGEIPVQVIGETETDPVKQESKTENFSETAEQQEAEDAGTEDEGVPAASQTDTIGIWDAYTAWLTEYGEELEYPDAEGLAYCEVKLPEYENPVLLIAAGPYSADSGVQFLNSDGQDSQLRLPLLKFLYWDEELHEYELSEEEIEYYESVCSSQAILFYHLHYEKALNMLSRGRMSAVEIENFLETQEACTGLRVGLNPDNSSGFVITDGNDTEYEALETAVYRDCFADLPTLYYDDPFSVGLLVRRRSDTNYASFLTVHKENPGRNMLCGRTYDSRSGEQLSLSEVVTDSDSFAAYVLSKCSENAKQYAVLTELGDPFAWTLESDGMTAYFTDDAGMTESVRVTFAQHPDWFVDSVKAVPESYSFELSDVVNDMEYDVDGDGETEEISFIISPSVQSYYGSADCWYQVPLSSYDSYIIRIDEHDLEISGDNFLSQWGYSQKITVVHTPEHEMLYLTTEQDDTCIFNSVTELTTGIPVQIADTERFKYKELNLSNPEGDILSEAGEMNYIFGPYEMNCVYILGENGIPEIWQDYMEFEGPEGQEAFGLSDILTFKMNLEGILMDGRSEVSTIEIKTGEQCKAYATDDESYVEVKMQDGRIVKLELSCPEERKTWAYSYYINGYPVQQVFDGLAEFVS